jgi:signal transduction histidine kinase
MKTGSTIKFLLLPIMLILCSLFYYFGELVQWAAWDSLRNEFIYGIHDIHRLLFLVPIIYAGYHKRVKGAIIVTLVSLAIFLPRALIVSPYPDPLLRMIFFVIIAGVIGSLTGVIRNQSEKNLLLREKIHTEKLNAMGQIAASIAHEINNPLAGVHVYNRLLSKKLSNDSLDKKEALDTLDKIDSAVGHCSQLVQDLLDFARQSEPIYVPSDISDVIDQAISPVDYKAMTNNVEIVSEDAENTSSKDDIG